MGETINNMGQSNQSKDNSFEKFKELMRDLFQFDSSDLDFGIYRILNYKRREIERFINEGLKNKVEDAFKKFYENFYEKAQNERVKEIDNIKNQVFNDLYNFFSRYYEEGDFIPQYRYSIKGHKYAIPYNGEEVKLYWVNQDQYYIKTGLLFRDYTFKAGDYKVVFRIVSAKEELGSNKATKERFFILDDENPIQIDEESKTIFIRFQYRELTEKDISEIKKYGGDRNQNKNQENGETEEKQNGNNNENNEDKKIKIKREEIDEINFEKIFEKIKGILGEQHLLLEDLIKEKKNNKLEEKKNNKPLLLHHISRFTAKNTKDYFIHKNLKEFLTKQLDYFIKSEVLDIETLIGGSSNEHITRARVVKEIGEDIIDFLSQIEDFQKRLWEKKKFVIKTEYVITTDRVPEEFYEDICKNKEQRKEWKDLGFEIPESKDELKNKKLPIDTKYFSEDFKERLLEKLTERQDLDDILDGLLIKSENWQALNLILNKYKEKVQTIYIDPPYNTGSDEFLYKDRYQHSSWLTMMENRLSLTRELMREDGVIFVSIDDREQERLKELMKVIWGKENFLAQIIRDIPDGTNLRTVGGVKTSTEYVISFFNKKEPSLNPELPKDPIVKELINLSLSEEIETRLTKRGNKLQEIKFPAGVGIFDKKINIVKKEGEFINPTSKEKILVKKGELVIENGILKRDVVLEAEWSMPNILKDFFSGKEVFDDSGQKYKKIYFNSAGVPYIIKSRNKILIPSYLNIKNEKDVLFIHLLGYDESPKEATIKPVPLIYLLVTLYGNSNSIILDFFAGSGTTAHAVMKLNKEDGGKRKFILVEMTYYFDTVIIPRLKKVAYSFNWKAGKPQDTDGIGIFFKYQILEQYEDTLDNIELKEKKQMEELFKDEYLLKYFLDYETKESPYLLNIEHLKNPFSYKLKVNFQEVGEPKEMVVDIPETFNYLLGIKVKKIKVRNNERKYLFILGEKEGKNIAIVWREYSDNWKEEDFEKDKEFIIGELKNWSPQIVYINGQSVLTKESCGVEEVKYIESEFKRLMEE